jgi:hypothetical protein
MTTMATTSTHHTTSSGGGGSSIVGGHYRVGKNIGEGSFGVVFEGQSRFLQRSALPALPTLHPQPCPGCMRTPRPWHREHQLSSSVFSHVSPVAEHSSGLRAGDTPRWHSCCVSSSLYPRCILGACCWYALSHSRARISPWRLPKSARVLRRMVPCAQSVDFSATCIEQRHQPETIDPMPGWSPCGACPTTSVAAVSEFSLNAHL